MYVSIYLNKCVRMPNSIIGWVGYLSFSENVGSKESFSFKPGFSEWDGNNLGINQANYL